MGTGETGEDKGEILGQREWQEQRQGGWQSHQRGEKLEKESKYEIGVDIEMFEVLAKI